MWKKGKKTNNLEKTAPFTASSYYWQKLGDIKESYQLLERAGLREQHRCTDPGSTQVIQAEVYYTRWDLKYQVCKKYIWDSVAYGYQNARYRQVKHAWNVITSGWNSVQEFVDYLTLNAGSPIHTAKVGWEWQLLFKDSKNHPSKKKIWLLLLVVVIEVVVLVLVVHLITSMKAGGFWSFLI